VEKARKRAFSEGGVMLLLEPPSDSAIEVTALPANVCDSDHASRFSAAISGNGA
jgi:hypothetical protein